MRKYLLGLLALAIATVAFFAFKTSDKTEKKEVTLKPSATWYNYKTTAAQNSTERKKKENYEKITGSPTCGNPGPNECSVQLDQDYGDEPDFTGVSFHSTTGMPLVGGKILANSTKP